MMPIFYAFLRNNARLIVFPAAVAIGGIGYFLEGILSSKYTPAPDTIIKQRTERLTADLEHLTESKSLGYENVLDKNLSPSLQNKK